MEERRAREQPGRPGLEGPASAPDPSSGTTRPSPDTLEHESSIGADWAGLADSVPGYTLTREIHRGGQGVVYEAIQQSTKRKVALKVMQEGPFAAQRDRARFAREIEVLAQLKHPNIVTIHDSGTAAGHVYFVMDYIAGQSLDRWMTAAPRSMEAVLRLFHRICVAVNAAHLRGVVHRDLKPGNIRVDADGEPHILDFGLAKVSAGQVTGDSEPQVMTMTGQFMGSLPWASPEQAEAVPGRIDPRTDVYALGVILYQMLTGRFPYEVVGNLRDVLNNILQAEPTRPSAIRREISPDVETIVLRCLQKDRNRRYQTAGELARDIERFLAGEPIAARRDSTWYLLRIRARAVVRRHPALTCAAIVVLATLLAHYWPGVPLIYSWTRANSMFERFACRHQPASEPTLLADRVCVVAITDRTDLAGIAAQVGLDADTVTRNPQCLRRAHGQLMTRLAAAGAAVVAWDIQFRGDSPYDTEFADGVRALREAGCDVIVAVDTWPLAPGSFPALSQAIRSATRWGCAPAGLTPQKPWRVLLAAQHGADDPLPSLSALLFAARRRPGCDVELSLDPTREIVTLRYRRRTKSGLVNEPVPYETDDIDVSAIRATERDDPSFGLRRGDRVAYYLLTLPPDDVLARATCEYGQVFNASPDELRRELGGRVVILGDRRDAGRVYGTPDGRQLWGAYAHAVAADMLLRGASIRIPRNVRAIWITALAAVLGAVTGWYLCGRRWLRILGLAALGALCLGLSLAAAWYSHTLYNPLIAILALLMASELCARARALHRYP